VVDEKIADNGFGDRGKPTVPELQLVHDLYQDAGGSFVERPDYAHSFGPGFEVMEMNFDVLPVNELLRGPRNWDAGTHGGHHDEIPILASLEVTDVTIVRQNFGPQLEVSRGFENCHSGRVYDDGIACLHRSGRARANPPRMINLLKLLAME
jgi:hypothetical protein